MTENTSLNLHSEDFWVKAETQDPPQEAPLDESDEDKVLFEGDTGELPEIVRNVLVHLLRGPYFERSSSRRLWHALVTNEAVIRSRLSELYLDLFLDEEAGIAFCRRPNLGELDVPTLLPRVRLRFLDSTLIVELRERLMRAQETGERVHVTRQDLREILRLYDAAALSNEALLERHLSGIVDRLVKRRILLTLKSGDDAFEISPVLPLLFTTSDIAVLRAGYADKAARDADRLGGRGEAQSGEGEE